MAQWYAARVYNRSELDVAHQIAGLSLGAYVPCESIDRIIMGRKRRSRRPCVPGYVFVNCHVDYLSKIRDLETVYGFVANTLPDGTRTPAQVNPSDLRSLFLAELFGEMDFTRIPGAWEPSKGERVRIKSGRWREYIGKILRMSSREAWIEPDKGGVLRVKLDELEAAA